jgi:bifunctional enzyme CysN/CysC
VVDGGRRAIWLVGLSGAGKSVTSQAIAAELAARSQPALVLDGDDLRRGLNADLGFSRADRVEAARRTAHVSAIAAAAGVVPVTAMITPYRESRAEAREIHERVGVAFFEVWVATPMHVCADRDHKGLYAAARRGALSGMTGVDDPFEDPDAADVVIDATTTPSGELARTVLHAVLGGASGASGA